MQSIFLSVLDMSITASLVILAVILARLLLKKAPKKFSYALWALVLLRLLCPWSIESVLSLIPEKTRSIPQSIALEESLSGNIGAFAAFDAAQRAVGDTLNGGAENVWVRVDTPETETVSASHTQVWLLAAGYVWPIGMAAMLLWSGVSYLRLRRSLRTAVRTEDDIWLVDGIDSPFVMGVFRPKIYLPSTIAEAEKSYIIAHERCHIRRRDHIIKLVAFAVLTLHWFNPLVWLAFALYSRDMEMSCDEAVIGQLGEDIRADYSASLLSLATGRRAFAGTPLAFGEGDPKGRIKNLAAWKKPAVWLSAAAVIVLIVAAVCLLTDPESDEEPEIKPVDLYVTASGYNIRYADLDHDGEGELIEVLEKADVPGAYYLRVLESDRTVIWEAEAGEAHTGWTSFLLYSEDGEDYLVEYCPGMWQGVGRYYCSVFHIQNRVEVELRRWTVDFELPTEMTADMTAFAQNVNAVLEKSRLLLSTLGGEVVTGPVDATEVSAVYPVTFYANSSPAYTLDTEEEQLCREAFAALGKAEYLHFTTEYYLDGVLCADMPRDEGWISGSDWLLRSEPVNEQGDYRQLLLLEKDGAQYAWMKISDKEQWLQSADGTYDSNLLWLRDGWGDELSFTGEEETESGRELSFEELYYGESGETMVGCIQIYRFDTDGALRAIIRTGGSAAGEGQEFTVVYSFPRCDPADCAEAIDSAYAEVKTALGLN